VGPRSGLIKFEIVSGALPRKESVMARKEFDSLLRVGVPKKLRLGECTLLRMSIDCLSKESKKKNRHITIKEFPVVYYTVIYKSLGSKKACKRIKYHIVPIKN